MTMANSGQNVVNNNVNSRGAKISTSMYRVFGRYCLPWFTWSSIADSQTLYYFVFRVFFRAQSGSFAVWLIGDFGSVAMPLRLAMRVLWSLLVLQELEGVFGGGMKSPSDPPPVILRIDDVTAGWCEEQAVAAVDAALELDTPISLGLIGSALDTSVLLSDYLRSVADNPLIEIASHSFLHDSFEGKSLAWQENDLAELNEMANKISGKLPMTFIPPKNEWDDNTIFALQNNTDLHILSGQCNWYPGTSTTGFCQSTAEMNLDVVAPNISVNGIYVLPAGAVLGDSDYWNNYLLPASVANATAWIESQISNQGFAVLMLHPVEFAFDSSCAAIDDMKIKVLTDLIKSNTATFPSGKWKFMLYHEAVEYLTGDVVVQSERRYEGPEENEPPVIPFFAVVLGILAFMLISCSCSYFAPEMNKCKKSCC